MLAVQMDISELQIIAPGPVAEDVTETFLRADTVAIFGRAKNLRRLQASPVLRHLWISGVNAPTAEIVGGLRGLTRLVMHDFRMANIGPLAALEHLRELAIAGSPKLRSLEGIERLPTLRSLVLFDCTNLSDIEPLTRLRNLETLCLEGGFSKHLSLKTLAPLAALVKLRRLRLASVKVSDGSLRPLHRLRSLKQVFIARAFSPAEFRALGEALPQLRELL